MADDPYTVLGVKPHRQIAGGIVQPVSDKLTAASDQRNFGSRLGGSLYARNRSREDPRVMAEKRERFAGLQHDARLVEGCRG